METEAVRYQFDTVEVQPAALTVTRDGQSVDLEPKAIRVLLYLIDHRDRAVTKEELMETVWEGAAVTDNALTRIVAQLRRELGDDARQARYIQTLPTTGYRFVAELQVVHPQPLALAVPPAPPRRSQRLAWVAAAAVLAAGATWTLRRGAGSEEELRPAQLTTSAGLDIGASFSPDGRSFVYSSNRSGRLELYRRPLGFGGDIQITDDGNQNIHPAWSPDGKWIAYHSVTQHGVWLVPVAGGTPHRLTAFGSAPAWSPDGRRLAFRSTEPMSFAWFDTGGTGPSELWTVSADGTQLRQVTWRNQPPGSHGPPVWSPDARSLAFVALSQWSVIWRLDLATGKREKLVEVGRDIPEQPGTWLTRLWEPCFSPSGKGLYFSAIGANGEYAIFVLPHTGARPQMVYSTRTEVPSGLALSPDGKRLLFTRFSNISQLWTVAPGQDPKPLFQEAVLRAYLPSFSPDGKNLSFLVETAGRNRDLWIMNADGSGAEPVSTDPGPKESANSWNLEGTGLLYSYVAKETMEFRRYDAAHKTSKVLYSIPTSAELFHPSLLPDEKTLLSACSRPLNICLSPAGGGPPRQITFEREGAYYPNPSRDGQWIAYEVRRGDTTQVGVIRRDGQQGEVLTDDPGLNWSYSFSPDNRRIAYASYRDGVWNIWWIDRLTRERTQLTHNTSHGSFVRSPAWRPGTEELVYEDSRVKGNVFLLDLP